MDNVIKTPDTNIENSTNSSINPLFLSNPGDSAFEVINGASYFSFSSNNNVVTGGQTQDVVVELPDVQTYVINNDNIAYIFKLTQLQDDLFPGRRYTIINDSIFIQRIEYFGRKGSDMGNIIYELYPHQTIEFISVNHEIRSNKFFYWVPLDITNVAAPPKKRLYAVWRFLMLDNINDNNNWNTLGGNPRYGAFYPMVYSRISCYGLMYWRDYEGFMMSPAVDITRVYEGVYSLKFSKITFPFPETFSVICQTLGEEFGTRNQGAVKATIDAIGNTATDVIINIKTSDDDSPNDKSFELYIFDLV